MNVSSAYDFIIFSALVTLYVTALLTYPSLYDELFISPLHGSVCDIFMLKLIFTRGPWWRLTAAHAEGTKRMPQNDRWEGGVHFHKGLTGGGTCLLFFFFVLFFSRPTITSRQKFH